MKNSVIEQILLHLYDCIDYGFSYRLKRGLWISEYFNHWKKEMDTRRIKEGIRYLEKQKLITGKQNYDGSVIVSLSEKGKLRALNLKFKLLSHKKEKWDKKWRIVAFDIPNERRKGRRALRYRLEAAGFRELQESLFIYPYNCEQEIRDFIKLFKLEDCVRFGILDFIDGQDFFIKMFKLDLKIAD